MANPGILITKKINQNKLITPFLSFMRAVWYLFNKFPFCLAIKES